MVPFFAGFAWRGGVGGGGRALKQECTIEKLQLQAHSSKVEV